ncbi:MAG: hypothetical protein M1817_006809 [Caeruleum heppii]|nr:MAG: hypothetical protein M1817_006809 [Caeruleum heppii]
MASTPSASARRSQKVSFADMLYFGRPRPQQKKSRPSSSSSVPNVSAVRKPSGTQAAVSTPAPAGPPAMTVSPESAASAPIPTGPPPVPSDNALWTKDRDDLLLKLKETDKKSWKDVQTDLKDFTMKDLRQRFRELKKAMASMNKLPGNEEKGTSETDKPNEKVGIEKKSKEETQKKGKESTPAAADDTERVVINIDPGHDTPVAKVKSYSLAADSAWRHDEVTVLRKLAAKHENHKWLEIASRFFDETGVRVSPEAVRVKLEKDASN